MSSGQRFAIVFSPATGSSVSRYVTRGFFSPREFPQAFARMVLTKEFGLFIGVPLILLASAKFVSGSISQTLTGVAVVWLIGGLLRISRYGASSGIGCYLIKPDGSLGKLVGGLRMRLERGNRRLWVAGLLVEPAWRGAGIGTALILAVYRLAQKQVAHGPVTVSVFAPSHPASRAIIERQLGGMQTLQVTDPPPDALSRTLERLEKALSKSPSTYEWKLTEAENIFS